jgi:hypothetical protein
VLRLGRVEPEELAAVRADGEAEAVALGAAQPVEQVIEVLDPVPQRTWTALAARCRTRT